MTKKTNLKGLGPKYGIKHRKQFTKVHEILKSKRRCPQCGSIKFRRQAVGIWGCNKCGFKIAGSAYDVNI
jgi:large subunit ribosomal protein L37Ae